MAEKPTPDAEAKAADQEGTEARPKKIRYHFLKSSSFRSIHADGVFGGVTPRLTIAATFFNERPPLPDQVVHSITEDGTLGPEITEERIVRDGIVRELEANMFLDVEFAKVLVQWLNSKIEFIEQRLQEARAEAEKDTEQSNAVS